MRLADERQAPHARAGAITLRHQFLRRRLLGRVGRPTSIGVDGGVGLVPALGRIPLARRPAKRLADRRGLAFVGQDRAVEVKPLQLRSGALCDLNREPIGVRKASGAQVVGQALGQVVGGVRARDSLPCHVTADVDREAEGRAEAAKRLVELEHSAARA